MKGVFTVPHTAYELKYCERCGSLGLRRAQSGETYCEPCGQILIAYTLPGDPTPRYLPRRAKPHRKRPRNLPQPAALAPDGRQP